MKVKKYLAIVNVNLEFEIKAKSKQDAENQLFNMELPNSYIEDSFELVKIMEEEEIK